MLTQPAAFDCGTIMSAFCAPAAVSGPVRSVALACEADQRRVDARRLEARLLDLGAVVDAGDLRIDDSSRLRVKDVLAERAPRAEHRVVGAEQREPVLALSVDRQELDAADGGLVVPERRVERLITDGNRAELDHADLLVVRELLAALRSFLLGGGGEAVLDDQPMPLDAAQVVVQVLNSTLDRRPSSPARRAPGRPGC